MTEVVQGKLRQGTAGRDWEVHSARWLLIGAFVAALLVAGACRDEAPPLAGTSLDGKPSPEFRLTDQRGAPVALAELRGSPVVLTFLYTTCPDICPLTAEKLRQTFEQLGKDAGKVAMVAISVDPERDTADAAAEFTAQHRLDGWNWHYLTGTRADLEPVWASYGIGVIPRYPNVSSTTLDAVGHTDALYVIDRDGRQRTLLRGDFDPVALAGGLRGLLK